MAKIINAVFGGGLFATTAKVFQYDVGDKLRFLGVDLPAGYSVDFANSRTGASTTVLGDADGVEIPPEYFIPGTDIYAWVVISDSDGHYTRYQAKIPIYERAARTSVEPTPAQADALDEAINALNSAVEDVEDIADGIPDQINAALEEAKESGEFDGPPGPQGPAGPQGQRGEQGPAGPSGEDGFSPTVTVTEITGGHRVTITDEDGDHVFDVMDGQGGGGTGDYADLTNKPSINGTTLSGNKSAAELVLEPEALIVNITQSGSDYTADKTYQQIRAAATEGKRVVAYLDHRLYQLASVTPSSNAAVFVAVWQGSVEYIVVDVLNAVSVQGSTIGTYSKPASGIPKTDLASAVQTSLGKADTALQSAPVTSVNGQTGAVSLSIPSTAVDVGAVAANQGAVNANKVLTVNSSGVVVPEDNRFVVTLTPTAADYSGTMDKTVAEIDAAYKVGKQVFFRIYSGDEYIEVNVTSGYSDGDSYPSFNAYCVTNYPFDAIIYLWTGTGASGNKQTYSTNIYPLATGQWAGGSY